MKKLLAVFTTSLVLFACSHNETTSTAVEASAPVVASDATTTTPVTSAAVSSTVEASAPVASVAK